MPSPTKTEGLTDTDLPEWAEAYDVRRIFENKAVRSACYAPYVTLDFSPNGEVFVCCVNTTYTVGRIPKDSILDIWRGEPIRRLREHLKRYDFSLHCERCRWQVDLGNFSGVFAKREDDYAVPQDPPDFPQRLDFRFSNVCNLACVMCNGDYSSVLRAREGRSPFARVYDERFFEQLDECIPHLIEARFTGGEPFLIAEHFKIWDLIIKHGARLRCMVNTNATVMNDRILDYLERVDFYNIGVSFDGATRETFETIRQGASFDSVLANTKIFKAIADRKGRKVHFAVCPMRSNWREFPAIVRLAEDLGCSVNVNIVWTPRDLSLYELPKAEIQEIRRYLEAEFALMRHNLSHDTKIHWKILIESLVGAEERHVKPPFADRVIGGKS